MCTLCGQTSDQTNVHRGDMTRKGGGGHPRHPFFSLLPRTSPNRKTNNIFPIVSTVSYLQQHSAIPRKQPNALTCPWYRIFSCTYIPGRLQHQPETYQRLPRKYSCQKNTPAEQVYWAKRANVCYAPLQPHYRVLPRGIIIPGKLTTYPEPVSGRYR